MMQNLPERLVEAARRLQAALDERKARSGDGKAFHTDEKKEKGE